MNMRKIFAVMLIAPLLIAISPLLQGSASPIINWGLSPNTREEVPVAPDGVSNLLKQYNGLYHSDTDEKKVFVTFDLGYEAGYTAQVLDILKENNIKGIFFLCGNYLTQEELINRMIAEGHTIGNHTDKHKDLPKLSRENAAKDMMDLQNAFKEKYPTAVAPIYMRPPQGRFDETTLEIANENKLRTMLWSIAIVDWGKTPIDAQKSADKIASRIHPGAIILCHITNSGTPKMLEKLIPQITEKGYTIGLPADIK